MNALVTAAALLLAQEPAELLKKIDGKDPAACFRTIAALAELDAKHRAEIEKGAASLPEFYRDALLAELRAPAPAKVTLKGAQMPLGKCLEELTRQAGIPFDFFASQPGGGALIDLDLDNVSAYEALAEVCARGQVTPWWLGYKNAYQVMNQGPSQRGFATRNAAMMFSSSYLGRSIVPGRAPVSYVGLTFMGASPHGEGILGWRGVRVYEATGDTGAPLAYWAFNADASIAPPMDKWLAEYRTWGSYPWFCLRITDDVKKISRLRFSIQVRVATKVRTLELAGPAAEGKAVVKQEGYEAEVRDIATFGRRFGRLRLRIKASTPELESMLCMLPVKNLLQNEKPGIGSHWAEPSKVEGGVEYLWTWSGGGDSKAEEVTRPTKITVVLPAAYEDRTIFAEFRDLQIR